MQEVSAKYKKFSILFSNILYLGKLNFFTFSIFVVYNRLENDDEKNIYIISGWGKFHDVGMFGLPGQRAFDNTQ